MIQKAEYTLSKFADSRELEEADTRYGHAAIQRDLGS